MPFKFSDVCALLSRIGAIETHDPPLLPADKAPRTKEVVESWFKSHRRAIRHLGVEDATALLSALLPEWRTDRVYNLQPPRLCQRLGRLLRLNADRLRVLEAYKIAGRGDLGECLERMLRSNGPPALPVVELEEVDALLQQLAGQSRFSDPSLRQLPPASSELVDEMLGNLISRMSPSDAKWLLRIILKDLAPVCLDENLVFHNFHFLLRDLLHFQRSFPAALHLLKTEFREYPEKPDPASARLFRKSAAQKLVPVVGTKVGRPEFRKARGIDHCLSMVGNQKWAVERKYDGEYCEIHIDLSRDPADPAACIKIFSKSGKESTEDRRGLHQVLIDVLRLGRPDCKIKRQVILLGEMVVYSDTRKSIMPFEHIRRQVARSGVYIGTEADSPPSADEHLSIVFFDILLLDDHVLTKRSVDERRACLRETCPEIPGRALRAEWKLIDFACPERAKKMLLERFAMSNARRQEGLVLKPCGVPYFSLSTADTAGHFIKLKKDLIGLGDEADFAVVGGSYDAQLAAASAVSKLRWTTFYLGCLTNKADVRRFGARPHFKVVGSIGCEGGCIPKHVLETANIVGRAVAEPYDSERPGTTFDITVSIKLSRMDSVFATPFVWEVLGSKFAKPAGCHFFMLIFPRVTKLHQDRTFVDCISFQELQEQARAANALPESESQETRNWVEKLERRCKRKIARESATPSPKKARLSGCLPEHGSTSLLEGMTVFESSESTASFVSPTSEFVCRSAALVGVAQQLRDAPEHIISPPCNQRTKRSMACRTTSSDSPLSELSPNTRHRLPQQARLAVKPPPSARGSTDTLPCGQCNPQTCPFANTTVFLAACVASTPYIAEDLLSSHLDIHRASSLTHWNRGSFAHPALSSTVAESQAYPGMRKIILVEMQRREKVREMIQQLEGLNGGAFRERVEVWDWRALEEAQGCNVRRDGKEEQLRQRHLLGALMWDDGRERGIFVHSASTRAQI